FNDPQAFRHGKGPARTVNMDNLYGSIKFPGVTDYLINGVNIVSPGSVHGGVTDMEKGGQVVFLPHFHDGLNLFGTYSRVVFGAEGNPDCPVQNSLFRHFLHLFNLGGGWRAVITDPEFMPESY